MAKSPVIGVVRFPGANCEQDCLEPLVHQFGVQAKYIWHQQGDLSEFDAIILPGGFSYGDYLRSGALASMSPVIRGIKNLAEQGKPVLGICNGFQVLTESGLLPGALVHNRQRQFICQQAGLNVVNTSTPFTQQYQNQAIINLPVAHAEGRYIAERDTLDQLQANKQIVFTYRDDINGSHNHIAGICNKAGNVLGMMPHPERALNKTAITTDEGKHLFESLLNWLSDGHALPSPQAVA
jgi:phosphoribosylformylglycinamidine synthase